MVSTNVTAFLPYFNAGFFSLLSFIRFGGKYCFTNRALKTGKALIEVLVIPTQTKVVYTPVSYIATLCYRDGNLSSYFFIRIHIRWAYSGSFIQLALLYSVYMQLI